MFNFLQPHGLQQTSLPCPSLSPGVCSNSCKLSQWFHPIILFSVTPFSSCPQSFPASVSFTISQLAISGGQNIGASASASVLPMTIQGWFLLGLTGLISLQSKGLSRVFSNTTVQKHQAFFTVQLSHPYMSTGTTIALSIWTFVSKVMSLLFNMLSRFVITFLPRSKHLYFMAVVTIYSDFGAQENKISHCFLFFPLLFAVKWWEQMPWSAFFECWVSSQLFHSPLSPSSRASFVPLHFSY